MTVSAGDGRMVSQIKFPDRIDVLREEAEKFQKLSPDEKWRVLESVIQTGLELSALSPNKERVKQLELEREAEWRKAHANLFSKYEKIHGPCS
jgi:hypothetical protein